MNVSQAGFEIKNQELEKPNGPLKSLDLMMNRRELEKR